MARYVSRSQGLRSSARAASYTTPEDFKAWSQKMGHEDVLTTYRAYGRVQDDRLRTLLADMQKRAA
jgi:hypothetical protein